MLVKKKDLKEGEMCLLWQGMRIVRNGVLGWRSGAFTCRDKMLKLKNSKHFTSQRSQHSLYLHHFHGQTSILEKHEQATKSCEAY